MERRRFLASVSAAAVPLSLAGCMGGQDDEPSETTTEPTDSPTTGEPTTTQPTESGPLSFGETAELSGDRALTVESAGASAFAVTRGEGDDQVHSVEDGRYVTVKFSPDGITDYRSFVSEHVTLTVNGEEEFSDPLFPLGGGPSRFDAAYAVPAGITPYTATVDVDTGDATASWEFDARAIEAITQTVDFSVTGLSAPDAVEPDANFTAELTVDNAGDAITFYGVLEGTAGAPARISEDLPAGETTTFDVAATAPEADGADEFEFAVDYGYDDVAETVAYE